MGVLLDKSNDLVKIVTTFVPTVFVKFWSNEDES